MWWALLQKKYIVPKCEIKRGQEVLRGCSQEKEEK